MWHTYHQPTTLTDALALLARHVDRARVIAGGTDLIIELERGIRSPQVLVDVTRIPGLDRIEFDEAAGEITLGPLVTHNDVVASSLLVKRALPLAQACWQVGAPQIRNRATVAGNLITASPANDTITPLWALDGAVTLTSQARGSRRLAFPEFFLGVRRTALQPDEMLTAIHLRALATAAELAEHSDGPDEAPRRAGGGKPEGAGAVESRGLFLKLGLRRAQAISVVNVAVVLHLAGQLVAGARITLGSVAPTIVRAADAEASLIGRPLSEAAIFQASELAAAAARPIDDVRGSADYRRSMVGVLTERALRRLGAGQERAGWPQAPVLLKTPVPTPTPDYGLQIADHGSPITFTLNGRKTTLENAAGKTLLRALRENAHLTGVKEGCAEGECGACTVWLEGSAVMACLVPAERAAGCDVVTVEGLAAADALHSVQQAFVDEGAVQCGYCTPGLIMSGAMLLAERAQPTVADIQQALAGNLCRCTGYAKVIAAIQHAANATS